MLDRARNLKEAEVTRENLNRELGDFWVYTNDGFAHRR
jgi:hypothetical protein